MALRALDKWLWSYLTRPRLGAAQVTDVLFCVCDHFEPFHAADRSEALRRVHEWNVRFPELSAGVCDADGKPPAHTFFYPIEQYDEEVLDHLAVLGRQAHTEVEIHLHHDRDTAAGLRRTLEEGKQRLQRHGLLSQDSTGATRFGFIHGDWALDDSHPSGRHCGVRTELTVLAEAGCYGDFTLPSAPSPTQTRTINSVYYAADTPAPKSHDRGTPMQVETDVSEQGRAGMAMPLSSDDSAVGPISVGRGMRINPNRGWDLLGRPTTDSDVGSLTALPGMGAEPFPRTPSRLLLVQGPLGLNWRRRKFGLLPRLENGELSGANPPTLERLRLWVNLGIRILGRPEWAVVKLHTHGALPRNLNALLGEPMRRFYRALLAAHRDGPSPRYHFVTARELVNILHAGEAGHCGVPGLYRDFRYTRAR
jgi:hypothetical protein